MKFINTWILAALVMGTAFTALANNETMTTKDKSEGMTTQMTEDDKLIEEEVKKTLEKGGYVGMVATVSAGTVKLSKGTVMEDKLQGLVDALSKIKGVNSVESDGVILSKMVPSS